MSQKKIFDEFTNQYSINKTLRFSLIPVLSSEQEGRIIQEKGYESNKNIRRQDRVGRFFLDNKKEIFDVDTERKQRYRALKYYLTELHKLFIKDSLKKIKLKQDINFSDLFNSWREFEVSTNNDRKKELIKKINDEKIKLAKFFGDTKGKGGVFQETAKQYCEFLIQKRGKDKIKGTDTQKKGFPVGSHNILLSQNVLDILAEKITEGLIEERVENDKNGNNKYTLHNLEWLKKGQIKTGTLAEYFDGWSTYFKNFNEIRGNLYKDEGRKEQDENLEGDARLRKSNAGQITTRILDENFEIFVRNAIWAEKNKKDLALSDFQRNDIIDNVSIFDSKFYIHCLLQIDINRYNEKIAELNKFFNEHKKEGKDIKYLKTLHKQLLLTDGFEDRDTYVHEFTDSGEFIDGLVKFGKNSQEKLDIVGEFLKNIPDNLDDIHLNENQLHHFCNKYFGSWSYLRELYYKQYKIIEGRQSDKKEDELKDKEGVTKTDISLSEIQQLLNSESKDNFLEAVKSGWYCRDFRDPSKSSEQPLKDAGVYSNEAGNFDNFLTLLRFELTSFLEGRQLLTKREEEDKGRFRSTKESLQKSQESGERVDGLLLSKFSDDDFVKGISESLGDKRISFDNALQEFESSLGNRKNLSHEKEFECKKAINEYCVRVSDINRFFALFTVPEGVVSNSVNTQVYKFKENAQIIPLFNAIRNYITKRGNEIENIKLNFDNQSLLGGWSYRTTDYKCRILKKDDNYYLLIIGNEKKDNNDPLRNSLSGFQVMNYYQQKGQTIFGSVYKGKFESEYGADREFLSNPNFVKKIFEIIGSLKERFKKPDVSKAFEKIERMQKSGKFDFEISGEKFLQLFKDKTNTEFSNYRNKQGIPAKEDVIIDVLKNVFGNYKFDYDTDKEYLINRIREITKNDAVKTNFLGSDRLVYEITKLEPYFYENSFRTIDFDGIDSVLNNKKLFLFQIYCKDFSQTKKGGSSKNLHTLYFEELFSRENQNKPVFKLSGGAEVFFREKVDDYQIERWERKDLRSPKTDKLPDKKRRFTENQILFHLPIVLNNINDGGNINRKIHKCIQKNEDIKILGIDRGEKELAYYCLLNDGGKIVEPPTSLNVVGSNIIKDKEGNEIKHSINYRHKLAIREKERMLARRSWTKVEGIKNLKEGYISNVINNIANLMVGNNAFVCLEELNYGFKKDRSIRIEKGVYQRLENALVDKLGFLVKEKTSYGVRNALQLAPENKAIKYWGNQMGAIFYTDAKFTSKTCPNCGFRARGISEFKKVENLKGKINTGDLKVFYEQDKDRFRIEYNWKYKYQENNKEKEFSSGDLYRKMEVIYSDIDRKYWNNDKLKELFVDYLHINEELFAGIIKNNKKFKYGDFIKILESLVWLRHTVEHSGQECDRISCPKCHFSTLSSKTQNIKDSDANGAYNIARRGLMIFSKIRGEKLRKKINTKNGIESKDLKITLKEWDEETFKQWDGKDWEESLNPREL